LTDDLELALSTGAFVEVLVSLMIFETSQGILLFSNASFAVLGSLGATIYW